MTNEKQPNRSAQFAGSVLPWLLAGGLLVIYLVTLAPWVTTNNLFQVGSLAGWNWHPTVFGPVTYLVTCPFHWLPANWIPLALNLLVAVCGALTLALLARSVALLPHDRTQAQRDREVGPSKVLKIRQAWLPPVLAVLTCGLQLTFWQTSTVGAGEMFDVLLFAYAVRCLLEFRISEKEAWLTRFALAFSLAVANKWAMALLIPGALVALVWIKGYAVFNPRFLGRMAACVLVGIVVLLLLPLVVSFSRFGHAPFWTGVRYVLVTYKGAVMNFPRPLAAGLCLSSLLPVFVIGIRWTSFFGDTSRLGVVLATSMFHVLHAFFLLFCIWISLDSPLSPRGLEPRFPALPLVFLASLSIGYFSGYFLLVFGTRPPRIRQPLNSAAAFLNRCVVGAIWLLLILAPALLVCKNLPVVLRNHRSALREYGAVLEQSLPPRGAVIFSDDPARLLYLAAVVNRVGKASDYLLVETPSLTQDSQYFQFLEQKNPQFKLAAALTNELSEVTIPAVLLSVMGNLSQTHELDYLQPSFGFYLEQSYLRSQRLFYRLVPYFRGQFAIPPLSQEEISVTQNFWREMRRDQLPALIRRITPPAGKSRANPMRFILETVHAISEPDREAQMVGTYYSRALDFWGVELQRQRLLAPAAECFQQALELNPDNDPAKINLEFNRSLQAGKPAPVQSAKTIEDTFGKYRRWDQILSEDGPFDEPFFCYNLGCTFATNGLYRQSIQQFERVRALLPDHLNSRLWLSQLYESPFIGSHSNALAVTEEALAIKPDDTSALFMEGATLIQIQDYARAIQPLTKLLTLQTNNYAARLNRAIAYLQSGNLAGAQRDYAAVAKAAPTTFQAYYGLGEIAFRQKDNATAIKNYQLYLTNAPPASATDFNAEEIKLVQARLKELSAGKP